MNEDLKLILALMIPLGMFVAFIVFVGVILRV